MPKHKIINKIVLDIKEEWDKDKIDWRQFSGLDSHNNYVTYITHKISEDKVIVYVLKAVELESSSGIIKSTGVGTKLKTDSNKELNKILEIRPHTPFLSIFPQKGTSKNTIDLLISAGLQNFSSPTTDKIRKYVFGGQEDLEERLDWELNNLIEKFGKKRKNLDYFS